MLGLVEVYKKRSFCFEITVIKNLFCHIIESILDAYFFKLSLSIYYWLTETAYVNIFVTGISVVFIM